MEFFLDGFLGEFHELEDFGGGGGTFVNEEVGVFVGDHGRADAVAFEAGLFYEEAGWFVGDGVFEEGAGGEDAEGLGAEAVLAQGRDLSGLGLLIFAGLELESTAEDDFVGAFEVRVAVVEVEGFWVFGCCLIGLGMEYFGGDEAVFGFESAAAGIAVNSAADGAGKADPRFEAGEVVSEHCGDEVGD